MKLQAATEQLSEQIAIGMAGALYRLSPLYQVPASLGGRSNQICFRRYQLLMV